jgi:hypothetical protein
MAALVQSCYVHDGCFTAAAALLLLLLAAG